MSLLTKTESNSIHAFLDTMDYGNGLVGREWAMYAQPEQEQHHDRNALTKATKDLMALDARGYAHQQPQQQYYYHQQPQFQQPQYNTHYDYPPGPVHSRQPTFPFLHQQRPPPPPPPYLNTSYAPPPRPYTTTPSTASTSSSSFSFPPDLPPSPVAPSPRRPSPKQTQSAPAAAPPTKRPRTTPAPSKPALLSASQKKANHIQSEQKRRANIRRGYEALCDSVPALRDAIREEEALTAVQHPPSTKGKRARGRGRADDGAEKVDGRAGPRSENIVLGKTIDYMTELLADREALRGRLDRARAALPPGHPARTPLDSDPLWEREWKGGVNRDGDEEAEDDEDDST
ncbi:hypothetical protein C8F04DRAFT_1397339 [Mycena alexandri]|uniref:BHLH domain-containing protein n=1 Tax=Mycena alexandri TaxID=1745969 RepID=A0AAD6SQ81_9AGAR|nr:hypothetical protein C8F04DRAFT_1397339 [Mycena alexandri]